MGQRGDGLIEVVLVDDDADLGEGVEYAPGPSIGRRIGTWWSGRPARLRSRAARLGATVAALTCMAFVVNQGSLAAAEAALASMPGRSVSLAEPLHEVWHLEDANPYGWVGDDLLVTGGSENGVRRIDPASGAVRWSVPTGDWCTPLDSLQWGAFAGGSVWQLDGARLICVSIGADSRDSAGRADRIVLLDPADGSTTPGPSLDGLVFGVLSVDGDIVVIGGTLDGQVLAVRWSADSEQTVWSYVGTERIIDASGGFGYGSGPGYLELQLEGSPSFFLDLATGQELSSPADASTSDSGQVVTTTESTLADGSTVRGSVGETASFVRTSADGTVLPPFPGWPIAVGVDDGSAGGIALAMSLDGGIAAVALSTGDTRWTTPGYGVVAVMGGVVVVVDNASVSAHDVTTGDEVWSESGQEQFMGTAVTDGRSVGYLTLLKPGTAQAGGRLVLRVVDLRTGVERSMTSLPGYSAQLIGAASDGTVLIGSPDGGISGFRP